MSLNLFTAQQLESVLRSSMNAFIEGSRGTGRTTRVINEITDKSILIVDNAAMKRFIETRLKEAGKTAGNVIVAGNQFQLEETIRGRKCSKLLFDHVFIEKLFFEAIKEPAKWINFMEHRYHEPDDKPIEFKPPTKSPYSI